MSRQLILSRGSLRSYYRHFKDKWYCIIGMAEHTETGEQMVIYQAMYGNEIVYVRPYDMFMSKVDKEKYPDSNQEYRFENRLELNMSKEEISESFRRMSDG